MTRGPRVLVLDCYDSYTNNVLALLRNALPTVSLYTIRNDQIELHQLLPHLASFDFCVVGPGPGRPEHVKDVGLIQQMWKLGDFRLPMFGICLGLQSLGYAFGGKIVRLHTVSHGKISNIRHTNSDIFNGLGNITGVRYHSLHVELNDEQKDLEPLAWADDIDQVVIMGLRHKTLPYRAVQYHPDSICSTYGVQIISAFAELARTWNDSHRSIRDDLDPLWSGWDIKSTCFIRSPVAPSTNVIHRRLYTNLNLVQIVEGLFPENKNLYILDSVVKPGKWSIIGVPSPRDIKLQYYTGEQNIRIATGNEVTLAPIGESVWSWIAKFMDLKKASDGPIECPFWGGLIGYISYEAGVETLVPIPHSEGDRREHPDINLVFVHQSIVLDNWNGVLYVQEVTPSVGWLDNTMASLNGLERSPINVVLSTPVDRNTEVYRKMVLPEKQAYLNNIALCQEFLNSGESYELCLTALSKIVSDLSSWDLFKRLREVNPAPFSSYISFNELTLVGASPERFLSWSREGNCVLCPIKGTVRKTGDVTRRDAELILSSEKEKAENLMIVDLIRNDLFQVAPNVSVSSLMQVEEYETVYQLVSKIVGQVEDGYSGWDVLARSLPPGSMTGAPKKRSVQILSELEGQKRGIYSGVSGYWSICGNGDWSVIIRSMYSGEADKDGQREWMVGAGGAITALSTAEGEWQEMLTKFEASARAFL